MILSPEVSREIAARASTFEERLANGNYIPHMTADPEKVSRRLDRWCQLASQGDRLRFEKLLALKGLDADAVRKGLGPVQLTSGVPDWIELLQEGLTAAASPDSEPMRFIDAQDPFPFEQIMAPFVWAARSRLCRNAGAAYEYLGDRAHAGLERQLLFWLVSACSSALILEFSIFRLNHQPVFRGGLAPMVDEPSTELYRGFVSRMLRDGLVSFFREYCVLARAVAKLMKNWIDSTAEFLVRLSGDWSSLEQHFQPGISLGKVEHLGAGISDPHRGGRSVATVTFTSGLTVVYKPKNLQTEEAYTRLLDWLNRQGTTLHLRGLNVLSRPEYGWVEFVEHAPPADECERARFYRRSGMLLCLFYVLESNDIHAENLIAAGEHPVLIDSETLIVPSLESSEPRESDTWAESQAVARINSSVLRVGMLPWWRPQAGQWHDPSALGGVGGEEVLATVWQGIETDHLERQATKVQVLRNRNVPFAAGDLADPGRFLEEVVAGFREMYELLTAHRATLLGAGSPLKDLADAPMRLVFRDTAIYFSILKNSMDAAVLRDGADRSVDLEVLSRVLLASGTNARFAPFLKAEKHALTELDVPFFTVSPQSRSLDAGTGGTIENCFAQSGYERVLDRLARLGADDLDRQTRIIRGSFWAKIASRPSQQAGCWQPVERPDDKEPAASADALLDEAVKIATRIVAEAVRGSDGSVTWISLSRRPDSVCYSFGPLGPGLFDGVSGIALFLAVLHTVTGIAEFRETALGAIKPMQRALVKSKSQLTTGRKSSMQDLPPGLTGLGSIVYACTRVANVLHDDTPMEVACAAASWIKPELFKADTRLDIFNGLAGAILGLISLPGNFDSGAAVTAIRCGDHILNGTAQYSR